MSNQVVILQTRPNQELGETVEELLKEIPIGWRDFFIRQRNCLIEIGKSVGKISIPRPIDVFEAYHLVPLWNVRVVILGQDPYPSLTNYEKIPHATGLAFSYRLTEGFSPSMKTVIKELKNNYPSVVINHSCLTYWAIQGVFLLNTALTFNLKQGTNINNDIDTWRPFIADTLQEIYSYNKKCIFVGWGKKAQGFIDKLPDDARRLYAPHPSPLNSKTTMLGCGHFKKINEMIEKDDKVLIDWNLR